MDKTEGKSKKRGGRDKGKGVRNVMERGSEGKGEMRGKGLCLFLRVEGRGKGKGRSKGRAGKEMEGREGGGK